MAFMSKTIGIISQIQQSSNSEQDHLLVPTSFICLLFIHCSMSICSINTFNLYVDDYFSTIWIAGIDRKQSDKQKTVLLKHHLSVFVKVDLV